MKAGASKAGIVGMLAGIGLAILSVLGFYLNNLLLILMILPSLFLIMVGITSQGKRLWGWGGSTKTARFRRTGREFIEASELEEKERRDRESGAAD
jgi:hypothetical protein